MKNTQIESSSLLFSHNRRRKRHNRGKRKDINPKLNKGSQINQRISTEKLQPFKIFWKFKSHTKMEIRQIRRFTLILILVFAFSCSTASQFKSIIHQADRITNFHLSENDLSGTGKLSRCFRYWMVLRIWWLFFGFNDCRDAIQARRERERRWGTLLSRKYPLVWPLNEHSPTSRVIFLGGSRNCVLPQSSRWVVRFVLKRKRAKSAHFSKRIQTLRLLVASAFCASRPVTISSFGSSPNK